MYNLGQGMPCQPANFLRALRTIPEASALGLIFSEANTITRSSVPRIIQSWNRFILQQIHQQYTDNMSGTLFGSWQENEVACFGVFSQ